MSEDKSTDKLEDQIRRLSENLKSCSNDGPLYVARYQSNGAWAIHYSTVRLTVATFTITTSLGVTAFAWNTPTIPIALGFSAILILGLAIFYWASAETIKMMNLQREKIGQTPTLCMRQDVPVIVVTTFAVSLFLAVCFTWGSNLVEGNSNKAVEPNSQNSEDQDEPEHPLDGGEGSGSGRSP